MRRPCFPRPAANYSGTICGRNEGSILHSCGGAFRSSGRLLPGSGRPPGWVMPEWPRVACRPPAGLSVAGGPITHRRPALCACRPQASQAAERGAAAAGLRRLHSQQRWVAPGRLLCPAAAENSTAALRRASVHSWSPDARPPPSPGALIGPSPHSLFFCAPWLPSLGPQWRS